MQKKKNSLDEKRIIYLVSNNINSMYGLIITVSLTYACLVGKLEQNLLVTWLSLSIALAVGRIIYYKKTLKKISTSGEINTRRTEYILSTLSTTSALLYSCFSVAFCGMLESDMQLFLVTIATGMVAVTINTNASSSRVFIPYTIGTMIPFCIWYAINKSGPESYVSLFIVIFCVVIIKSSKGVNNYITTFLETKQDNEHLLNNLKKRKKDLEETNKNLKKHIEKNENLKEKLITQESLAGLGVLTAGLAHEIRNPLNFIINSAAILNEIHDDLKKNESEISKVTTFDFKDSLEDAKISIDLISSEGTKADSIVSQLLSTYDHQKVHSTNEFSVHAMISQISKTISIALRTDLSTSKAIIRLESANNLPKLKGHEGELSKVFYSIINNSIDAIKEKHTFDPDNYAPLIKIEATHVGDEIKVQIYDNGVGVKQENINKLLTPFYTTKPTNKSTGLGLSSSFDIVKDLFKGSVDIESKLGQFTIVTISLPLEPKD